MRFRALVRLLKTIGIVLAIIVSSYQIVSWVRIPRTKLVAEISYGEFQYPLALGREIKAWGSLAEDSVLASKLDANYLDQKFIERYGERYARGRTVSSLAYYLRTKIPYDIPAPYSGIHGYWSVLIRNGGRKTARGVSLVLPYVVWSEVYREGGISGSEGASSLLKFESLEPHEEIRVKAWTSIEPTFFTTKEIRFAHENGLGRISVQVPTGEFWHWMESNLFLVIWVILILITCPYASMYSLFTGKRKGRKEGDPPNSACS